jgi:hypothetical protein
MEPSRGLVGPDAKIAGEDSFAATFGLNMVNGAGGDGGIEHLFKTECLGAKLHIVVVPASSLGPLVLNRVGDFIPCHVCAELDDIGFSGQPQPIRFEKDAVDSPPARPFLTELAVGAVVSVDTFKCVGIVRPDLLDAVQCAATFAEEQVVEGTQWEVTVLVRFGTDVCRHADLGIFNRSFD